MGALPSARARAAAGHAQRRNAVPGHSAVGAGNRIAPLSFSAARGVQSPGARRAGREGAGGARKGQPQVRLAARGESEGGGARRLS
jgi:hypothetical protein